MKTILFVCTGNTCRSSMAEGIMKKLVGEFPELKGKINVISAGISAFANDKASSQAIRVMEEMGIDIRNHRATPLTKSIIDKADLILTMTKNHKQAVLRLAPEAEGKVFTLKQFADDIDHEEDYKKASDQICNVIIEKRNAFYARYGEEIERIKQRCIALKKELAQVEDELKAWEERLEDEIRDEKRKLLHLMNQDGSWDIADPFGQPVESYRACANEIKESLEKVLEKLIGEVDKN